MPRGLSAAASLDRHPPLVASSAHPRPQPSTPPSSAVPFDRLPPADLLPARIRNLPSTPPSSAATIPRFINSAEPSSIVRAVSIPPRHSLPAALAPVGDRCTSCCSAPAAVPPESPRWMRRFGGGAVGGPRNRSDIGSTARKPRRSKFEFSTPRAGMCDVVEIQSRMVRNLNNPRQQLRLPTAEDEEGKRPRTLLIPRSAALPRLLHTDHLRTRFHQRARSEIFHQQDTVSEPPATSSEVCVPSSHPLPRQETADSNKVTDLPVKPEIGLLTKRSEVLETLHSVEELSDLPEKLFQAQGLSSTENSDDVGGEIIARETPCEFYPTLDHGFSPVPSAGSELIVRRQGSSSYDYLDAANNKRNSSAIVPTYGHHSMYQQSEYNMYQHRKYTKIMPANRTVNRRHVRFQEPQVIRFLNVDVV